jgi:hypothetical protein
MIRKRSRHEAAGAQPRQQAFAPPCRECEPTARNLTFVFEQDFDARSMNQKLVGRNFFKIR